MDTELYDTPKDFEGKALCVYTRHALHPLGDALNNLLILFDSFPVRSPEQEAIIQKAEETMKKLNEELTRAGELIEKENR